MARLWFKCTTPEGRSIQAGGFTYPLPTYRDGKWVPGKATPPISRPLSICAVGYHLTTLPGQWIKYPHNVVWVAEPAKNAKGTGALTWDYKKAYSSVRLLRPATQAELVAASMSLHGLTNQAKLWKKSSAVLHAAALREQLKKAKETSKADRAKVRQAEAALRQLARVMGFNLRTRF